MQNLGGKTAVITGAASGMGKAFATKFATLGMNVVLADIEAPMLDTAVEEVSAAASGGATAIGVVTDVADATSVRALAAEAIDAFGMVNVLCNNAGVGGGSLSAAPGSVHLPDWQWVMGVNFWGVVHGHEAFLPHMLAHGDGHIVNTASMAGHFPGHSAYAASKWAVVGITEGLYNSLRASGSGVGVSCLCPGWINTAIGGSVRNRPEWAAPNALDEPDREAEARHQFVLDALASGLQPESVADLVADAVLNDTFWIFTHPEMVAMLEPRYRAILDGGNPDFQLGAALRGD
jgi:NAD(P)-dependent dehydrogenase (short-subunit alcohol dehydrogenase family)